MTPGMNFLVQRLAELEMGFAQMVDQKADAEKASAARIAELEAEVEKLKVPSPEVPTATP